MLTSFDRIRGFSLIELMIGVAIMAILFGLGMPSFREWMQNSQIRTATEAVKNGLDLARAEAVKSNTTAQFVLCNLPQSSWDVLIASAPAAAQPCNSTNAVAPTGWERVQMRPAKEGSANTVVAAGLATILFNGLGRTSNVPAIPAAGASINVSNTTGGQCVADGGEMRCLRVVVSLGGQIRMCDPAVLWSTTKPQGC